jgi:NAD(P)-dependent dehydrogenase (short-subunit alcohol dehydrogenase family)
MTRSNEASVFVVTGVTGALGKAVASRLAGSGTVVLVGRDRGRVEQAAAEIRRAHGDERAEVVLADFADLGSVGTAAEQILARHPGVDVLVNVAGVYKRTRAVTRDGLETMFQVNHLAPFLLTQRLLPALEKRAPARVITVAAPSTTRPDLDDLNGERRFNSLRAFGASKMCNLLFGFELARRVDPNRVSSNLVHPGLVRSALMAEAAAPLRVLLRLVSRAPDEAAEGIAWLALDPSLQGVSGRFYKGRQEIGASPLARDAELQAKLWDASVRMIATSGAARGSGVLHAAP